MTKIEQLTPEDAAIIPIVREEWRKISLATGPADRQVAQAAIADAYRQAGLDPPERWIWFGSPWAGCIGAWMLMQSPTTMNSVWYEVRHKVSDPAWIQVQAQVAEQVQSQIGIQVSGQVGFQVAQQVEDQVREEIGTQLWTQVWNQVQAEVWALIPDQLRHEHAWADVWERVLQICYGQHDAGWLSALDMFRRMKRVNGLERLEPTMRVAAAAGWWWPFAGACIVTERPTLLRRDEGGRLHCDYGPALAYPDGCAIYAWHGLRIPVWVVEEKARITPDAIEAETNAELRRVMLEIFGFDRYIGARGARLIAEDECLGLPRQLFEIDLAGETIRVLRVVNGTVEPDGRRRQFHLGVPLECNTPHEAVAWSYGRPAQRHTEAVRT
jgi:hypothetical protein